MSYLALARKWRPKVFPEVVGQAHVVSALTNALNSQRVHHAFLFTGTRGVGKTTLARIFAKSLNCEVGVSAEPCGECVVCRSVEQGNFVDLIEVDAASRTKVDDTRKLLDNVQYTPTQGRYKVYLIDEVHMLSIHSFNALLKTLEEPPEHVKFLLATTNPQKLPTTILSRCIQFNLKSVDIVRLFAQLEKILDAEKIKYQPSALMILARSANGSVRDALSLLDQAIAFSDGDINAEQVRAMLGMIDDQFIMQLLRQLIAESHTTEKGVAVLEIIAKMAERAVDYGAAVDELLSLIHNVSLYQVSPQAVEWKGIDSTYLSDIAKATDAEILQLFYQIAIMGKRDFDVAPDPRSGFEMILMRMLAFQPHRRTTSQVTAKAGAKAAHPATPSSRATAPKQAIAQEQAKAKAIVENEAIVSEIETEVSSEALANAPTINPQTFMNPEGWQRFICDLGLKGLSKQILMNMLPQSVAGKTVNLTLDSASRHLCNDKRLKEIEQHCRDYLSLDIKLNVKTDDADADLETPARQFNKEQEQKESSARQAFTHDSNVQELVDLFDAEIVNDSIKSD